MYWGIYIMENVPSVFKEYVAMWKNYANFSDRTNVRGYWMAFLWNWVASFALGYIGNWLNATILATLYGVAALVPGLALSVRRLKDMGKPWQYIFFALIPIVGAIMLIVWLTKPSIPEDGTPVV